MKSLFRILAVLCLIAGLVLWYSGGREKLSKGWEDGKLKLIAEAGSWAEDEGKLLERALTAPGSLEKAQKQKLKLIVEKLSASKEVRENPLATEALERLKSSLAESN